MRLSFDPENLRIESKKNKILKKLLPAIANQDERCKSIPIEQFLASPSFSLNRSELVRGLKKAQEHNVGRFIAGRRGKPSRFDLAVRPRDLRDVLERKGSAPQEVHRQETTSHREGKVALHSYRLRADLQINFELPVDLQKTEASRLAKFILSLPFEGVAE